MFTRLHMCVFLNSFGGGHMKLDYLHRLDCIQQWHHTECTLNCTAAVAVVAIQQGEGKVEAFESVGVRVMWDPLLTRE